VHTPVNDRCQIVGEPDPGTIIDFGIEGMAPFWISPDMIVNNAFLHERNSMPVSVGVIDRSGKIAPPAAPVAQWIEQPPPKGQVARSIRVRGANR
jgi:hypothetical protein